MEKHDTVQGYMTTNFFRCGCFKPRDIPKEKSIIIRHKLEFFLQCSFEKPELLKQWLPCGLSENSDEGVFILSDRMKVFYNGKRVPAVDSLNHTPCLELYHEIYRENNESLDNSAKRLIRKFKISKNIWDYNWGSALYPVSIGSVMFKKNAIEPSYDQSQPYPLTKSEKSSFNSTHFTAPGQSAIFLPVSKIEPHGNTLYLPASEDSFFYNQESAYENPNAKIILTDSLYLAQANQSLINGHLQRGINFMSWYGGTDGFKYYNCDIFHGRNVYYMVHPHSGLTLRQLYETAQIVREKLEGTVNLFFINFCLENQSLGSTEINIRTMPEILNIEQFDKLMEREFARKSFRRAIMSMTTPLPPDPRISEGPPLLPPFMNKGSFNVFISKSKPHNPSNFYMPIAYGISLGKRYSMFEPESLKRVLHIYGDRETFSFDKEITKMYRNFYADKGDREALEEVDFMDKDFRFPFPLASPRQLMTILNDEPDYFWKVYQDTSLDLNEQTANTILDDYEEIRPDLLILDFTSINKLFDSEDSALFKLIEQIRNKETTVWIISRKNISKAKVQNYSPANIFCISSSENNNHTHVAVNIETSRRLPEDVPLSVKYVFDNNARAFLEQAPRGKYAHLEPVIRNLVTRKVREREIADEIGVSIYTLRQLKRQFGIRSNRAPKKRRKGIYVKIISLYEQGKNVKEIADEVKTSIVHVKKSIAKHLTQRSNV